MDYEMIVAYIVVFIVFSFGAIPMLGSGFSGRFSTYKEDFLLGWLVVIVIAVIFVVGLVSVWAFTKIFS